jgi:hypothetical protein
MCSSAISREGWSARYEQLRAGWLAHELTWGQALFIRQGMAAWMRAWPVEEPSKAPVPLASTRAAGDCLPSVAMGGELQRHLARELAALILHRPQEIIP